jgi:hypothetical protein
MNIYAIVSVKVCMCMERKSKLRKTPVLHVVRQVQYLIWGSGISLPTYLFIYPLTNLFSLFRKNGKEDHLECAMEQKQIACIEP